MQINSTNTFSPNYLRPGAARQNQIRDDKTENNQTKPNQASKDEASSDKKSAQKLDQDEKRELEKLKARDREVRAHEAAHKAVAGQYATSGASFTYQRGPDGKLYAAGGEVSISTSPIPDNPEATLQKANTIRAAALAPAQPSAQDRSVAAKAAMMAAEARGEITAQQQEEFKSKTELKKTTEDSGQQSNIKKYEANANHPDDSSGHKIDLMA